MVYCFERTFEILDLKVGEIGNIQDPQVKVFPLDENLNAWKIINLSPKTWFYEGKIIINSNRGPNFELHLKKKTSVYSRRRMSEISLVEMQIIVNPLHIVCDQLNEL